jgi:hypothetical protein
MNETVYPLVGGGGDDGNRTHDPLLAKQGGNFIRTIGTVAGMFNSKD